MVAFAYFFLYQSQISNLFYLDSFLLYGIKISTCIWGKRIMYLKITTLESLHFKRKNAS